MSVISEQREGEGKKKRYFHEGHELHKEWVSLNKPVFLFLSQQGKLRLKNTKCTIGSCSYSFKKQKWLCCGLFDWQLLQQPWPGFEIPFNLLEPPSGLCRSCGKHQVFDFQSVHPFEAKGTFVWRLWSPSVCVRCWLGGRGMSWGWWWVPWGEQPVMLWRAVACWWQGR